jgi:hypothetical protein
LKTREAVNSVRAIGEVDRVEGFALDRAVTEGVARMRR